MTDDASRLVELAARRQMQLEQLPASDVSCAASDAVPQRVFEGVVSGNVSKRAALALDVILLNRWTTIARKEDIVELKRAAFRD